MRADVGQSLDGALGGTMVQTVGYTAMYCDAGALMLTALASEITGSQYAACHASASAAEASWNPFFTGAGITLCRHCRVRNLKSAGGRQSTLENRLPNRRTKIIQRAVQRRTGVPGITKSVRCCLNAVGEGKSKTAATT